jgi:hypothetical protein
MAHEGLGSIKAPSGTNNTQGALFSAAKLSIIQFSVVSGIASKSTNSRTFGPHWNQ